MPRIKRTKEEIENDVKTQSKVCCVCNNRKPFSDFYNFKNKSDNKSYRCKKCDDAARLKYRKDNIENVKLLDRDRQLRFKYKISLADYENLLNKQNGKCAICGGEETKGPGKTSLSFSVDHSHETGEVRGLLCNSCNRGLGLLGDNLETINKAVDYLETFRKNSQ